MVHQCTKFHGYITHHTQVIGTNIIYKCTGVSDFSRGELEASTKLLRISEAKYMCLSVILAWF